MTDSRSVMTDDESRPAPHGSQPYSLQHTGRHADDSVLGPLIEVARRDTETLGLLLHGSRAADMEDERSDYDLLWILTDREYQRRVAAEQCAPQVTMLGDRKHIELAYASPERLLGAGMPGWYIRGLATARILVDRNGEIERLMNDLLAIPEERVRREVPEMFDVYLNGFYRSMKASRRGNELGARLEAADSLTYLVQALFLLEGRWPPFHDRLMVSLDALSAQGWAQGELEHIFLDILRSADPPLQQRLEDQVERLMRDRGYGGVIDDWDGEIDRVKSS